MKNFSKLDSFQVSISFFSLYFRPPQTQVKKRGRRLIDEDDEISIPSIKSYFEENSKSSFLDENDEIFLKGQTRKESIWKENNETIIVIICLTVLILACIVYYLCYRRSKKALEI